MLGIGNMVTAGSKVANVVRRGLQAWYMADKTQAPLGEEEIANGEFTTGPELLANGDYSNGESDWDVFATGWDVVDGKAKFTGSSAANIQQNSILVASSTYQVTLTVSGMSAGSLSVRLGTAESDEVESILSNGTYTAYGVAGGVDFRLRAQSLSGFFNGSVDNVSVKRTNPNDSWNINSGTTVKDGEIFLASTNSGTAFQNILTVGKKYYYSFLAKSDDGGGNLKVADGADVHRTIEDVPTTYTNYNGEFTAGNATFQFSEAAAGDISIKNVSVKEITNSVKDFSPNNNNGVLYSGKALSFDGGADTIDLGSKSMPNNTEATFAVWVNPVLASGSSEQAILVYGKTTAWFKGNDKISFYNLVTDSVTQFSIPDLSNKWHRLVITITDQDAVSVYIDGEYISTKTAPSTISTTAATSYIGSYDAGRYLQGKLADFQIYDKAWTASDVTYDYNNPDKDVFDGSSNILPTDCTALYRLNEGAGDRVYNAAPVLGANLIGNSDFSSDVDGWQQFRGVMSWDSSIKAAKWTDNEQGSGPVGFTMSNGVIPTSTGKLYRVKFVAKTDSSSSFNFSYIGESDTFSTVTNPNLTSYFQEYEFTFIASGNSQRLYIGFSVSPIESGKSYWIDNVSLKEISLSDSYVQTSWASSNWITAQPHIPQYAMSSYSKKAIFDGAADKYIDCGTGLNDTLDDGFTVSCWFSVNTFEDYKSLFDLRNNTSPEEGFEFRMMANGTMQAFFDWGASTNIPTPTLDVGQLYHVVATIDKSTSTGFKLYLDGTLVDEKDISDADGIDTTCDDTLTFMKDFDGFGDEISVFNKVLSATEVQEIFNAGMALDCRDHSAYLGGELVTDTDLNDDTYWGSGSTYTAGTIVFSDDGLKIDSSKNVTGTHDGTEYIYKSSFGTSQYDVVSITYTITDYVSGQFRAYIGSSSGSTTVSGNGTYTFTDTADTDQVLYLQSKDNFIGTISSISVKKVDLKGYWRNNGTDIWTDLSPYVNNGTVNGSPTTIQLQEVPYFKKDTFGLPMNKVRQRGLNLDGDSYIKIDDDNDFNMSSGFSTCFWVNCRDITTRQWLVTKGTAVNSYASDKGFGTTILNSKIYASINTSNNKEQVLTTDVTEGDWLYVTVTYTPDTSFKLYINEDLIDTDTPSGTVDETHDVYIGENYELNTGYTSHSIIDEVKWYNRPLGLSEIKKNYKATKSQHKNNTVSNWSDDFSDSFI